MHISLRWLNEYLEPGNVTAEEAERVLTYAGFPIESATTLPSGDVMLDVEVTSNRGDVLSHIGVAREIAAAAGASVPRRLKLPAPGKTFDWFGEGGGDGVAPGAGSRDVGAVLAVDNRVQAECPLFTARVITGAKVGPSPKWLVAALEGVGQRSINNVVDITNFVGFEYGQPSHVFDMATLSKGADGKARIVVRAATKGEKLALLDGKTVELRGDEVVVCDGGDGVGAGRVVSLAGVMGGADTGVSERTTDIVLEAATWEPVAVRRAARRFGLRTDASYRFERIVDARTIEGAGKRLAALICRLTGGRLLPGVIHAGAEPKPLATVRVRPSRVTAMLGVSVAMPDIQRVLEAHEIATKPEPTSVMGGPSEPVLACTIPAHRPDLEREIDLVEEVARTNGLDKLPVHEMVDVRVAPPQASERAVDALGRVLTGLGFYEAVTFTFVSPKAAKAFVPAGLQMMLVCDERRKADPVLRPSALVSLLACRRANQDRGVLADGEVGGAAAGGGLRLFEISSVFAETPPPPAKKGERGKEVERVNVAMLADCCFPAGAKAVERKQAAVRLVRGAIESAARALGGESVRVEVIPSATPPNSAWDAGAFAEVKINGVAAGCFGVIAAGVQAEHGLETPVVAAELSVASLIALWPPKSVVHALPAFPSIERDLSLIVREETAWGTIDSLVAGLKVERLESWAFVGAYRGAQAGPGKKSVTMRMRFRDAARTLTHEEVSPQVEAVIGAARKELGAEVRTV